MRFAKTTCLALFVTGSLSILASNAAGRECGSLSGKSLQETAQLQARCRGREFLKLAVAEIRQEPTLYRNKEFADFQSFTLEHQRFAVKNKSETFRVFHSAPRHVRLESFLDTYRKMAKRYSLLVAALPDHLDLHRSMFTEAGHDRRYMESYDRSLQTLLSRPGDGLDPYEQHDCDYLAQPVNALRFSLNTVQLMDDYARTLWGEAWEAQRAEVLSRDDLLSPEAALDVLRNREPYRPAPQFPADTVVIPAMSPGIFGL